MSVDFKRVLGEFSRKYPFLSPSDKNILTDVEFDSGYISKLDLLNKNIDYLKLCFMYCSKDNPVLLFIKNKWNLDFTRLNQNTTTLMKNTKPSLYIILYKRLIADKPDRSNNNTLYVFLKYCFILGLRLYSNRLSLLNIIQSSNISSYADFDLCIILLCMMFLKTENDDNLIKFYKISHFFIT